MPAGGGLFPEGFASLVSPDTCPWKKVGIPQEKFGLERSRNGDQNSQTQEGRWKQ